MRPMERRHYEADDVARVEAQASLTSVRSEKLDDITRRTAGTVEADSITPIYPLWIYIYLRVCVLKRTIRSRTLALRYKVRGQEFPIPAGKEKHEAAREGLLHRYDQQYSLRPMCCGWRL